MSCVGHCVASSFPPDLLEIFRSSKRASLRHGAWAVQQLSDFDVGERDKRTLHARTGKTQQLQRLTYESEQIYTMPLQPESNITNTANWSEHANEKEIAGYFELSTAAAQRWTHTNTATA